MEHVIYDIYDGPSKSDLFAVHAWGETDSDRTLQVKFAMECLDENVYPHGIYAMAFIDGLTRLSDAERKELGSSFLNRDDVQGYEIQKIGESGLVKMEIRITSFALVYNPNHFYLLDEPMTFRGFYSYHSRKGGLTQGFVIRGDYYMKKKKA